MFKTISSTSNPTIKGIKKLRQKKERDRTNRFLVEGIRLVGEAFQAKDQIETLIFCEEILDSEFGLELIEIALESEKYEVLQVNELVFNTLASKEGPQGIAAIARQKWHSLNLLTDADGLWIGIHEIQDPGNLGSILRSADGAGAEGIILIGNSTDPYHPTAVRASMGAIFAQSLIRTSLHDFMVWKKSIEIHAVGAVCDSASHYKKYNYPDDILLLLGSEQKGLPGEMIAICDGLVNIPLFGKIDSLNIANAASILIFEIINQNKKKLA